MEINEMNMEQIEVRKAEIRELLKTEDCDVDDIGKEVDALEARAAEIRTDVEQRKAVAAKVASGAGITIEKVEERKMTEIEVRNTPAYINAYAEYIKSGDDAECRALLTENVSGGTVPVPEFVYDIVKTAWEKEGVMSRVRKSYLKGNLKVGFEISSTGAVKHTEGAAAVSEENLTLGIVTLIPASIKKWISVSDEVIDMRGEEFLRYVYDELAYQIAKKAADDLVANIEATTTAGSSTSPKQANLTANTISVGTIAQALALLSDEAANPVVIMNKATWGAFKAAQYANGYAVDIFEGLPVVFNNTVEAFATATTGVTYAIVGDLGHGALANFPNGEEIKFNYDDKTLATQDLVRIIGREFVAAGVVAPNAFVKIKK